MQIIDINGITRECKLVVPDKNFPGYMKLEYVSKNRKGFSHLEWYPIIEFIKNNPKFSKIAEGARLNPKEDLGAVTKAGNGTLEDLTKDWPKNIYAGTHLWISRGKGEGQQREIIKNDKNKLYIDRPWKEIPDKSSQYVVSFNVRKDIKPAGNTLPGIETRQALEKLIKKAKKSLIN